MSELRLEGAELEFWERVFAAAISTHQGATMYTIKQAARVADKAIDMRRNRLVVQDKHLECGPAPTCHFGASVVPLSGRDGLPSGILEDGGGFADFKINRSDRGEDYHWMDTWFLNQNYSLRDKP